MPYTLINAENSSLKLPLKSTYDFTVEDPRSLVIASLAQRAELETFNSAQLPYVNGTSVSFTHDWTDFNPLGKFFQVQASVVCIAADKGWQVGEKVLVSRGATVSITSTEINIQIGANGISVTRKDGNLNEGNLNSSSWELCVTAVRRVSED